MERVAALRQILEQLREALCDLDLELDAFERAATPIHMPLVIPDEWRTAVALPEERVAVLENPST